MKQSIIKVEAPAVRVLGLAPHDVAPTGVASLSIALDVNLLPPRALPSPAHMSHQKSPV